MKNASDSIFSKPYLSKYKMLDRNFPKAQTSCSGVPSVLSVHKNPKSDRSQVRVVHRKRGGNLCSVIFVLFCTVFFNYSKISTYYSSGKESACSAGDPDLIPGLGRSPGEGNNYPLQYSGLENSMDCIVHGVTKSWTRLSNLHFHTLVTGEKTLF